MTGASPPVTDPAAQPFVASCRRLPATAALGWLKKGWQDLRRAPRPGLIWGLVITILSWGVTALAFWRGSAWAVLVLLSGFVFIGPVLALGFYSISRQLEAGRPASLRRCIAEQRHHGATTMVFALALMIVFLVWARAGSMVHVFFPVSFPLQPLQVLQFLAIGSAVGSIFALITFAVSAYSLPMIADRQVDAITAIVTSVNAVLRNKRAMTLWAALIVAGVIVGMATLLLGMIVIMPLLGHATWHAYRETIDASPWPAHDF